MTNPNPPNQFKKGQSGNPAGRKKGSLSLIPILKKELLKKVRLKGKKQKITYARALIKKILKKAIIEEDVQMIKDIFNRVDGMPKQSMDLGLDDNITEMEIKIVKDGSKTKGD